MTVLPILERELRVRARQPLTFWVRGICVAIATLLSLQLLNYAEALGGPASFGREIFLGLVGLAALVGGLGCLATADAISHERREQTLGLLQLTGIRAHDMVFGKLLSACLQQTSALLAFVPVLMLPVLAGGVRGSAAALSALALGHLMFCSVSVGLWASARHSEWFKALRLALLGFALWLIGPWLVGKFWAAANSVEWLSPGTAVLQAVDANAGDCLLSVAIGQLGAWSLLWRTARRLHHKAAESEPHPTSPPPQSGLAERGSLLLSTASTFASRAKPLNQSPLRWLLRRQRGVKLMIWLATGLTLILQVAGLFMGRFMGAGGGISLQFALYAGFTIISAALIAGAASRFFAESRRSGEIEMLLTTPIGATQIISAQWRYLRRQLVGPVLLLALLNGLQYLVWLTQPGPTESNYLLVMAIITLSGLGIAVNLAALCWAAMYFGARLRSQLLAIISAVAVVKLGVTIISSLAGFLLVSLPSSLNNPFRTYFYQIIIYQLPVVAWAAFLIWYFHHRLNTATLTAGQAGLVPWSPGIFRLATWQKLRHWPPGA